MKFIRKGADEYSLSEYLEYLATHANRFPPGARSFALAPWHYDISHRQCPHDSWVEHVLVKENATGARREVRYLSIKSRFFGAFHDGFFDIEYVGVDSYVIGCMDVASCSVTTGHGDWLVDETTLTDEGKVRHEIIFSSDSRWTVECEELVYTWEQK